MKKSYFIILLFLCLALGAKAQSTHWSVNIYDYQYDMSAYIALTADGEAVTDYSEYELAAFCGDECRGVATVQTVGSKSYCYMRIRSNQDSGEAITFKVYVKDTEREVDVENYTMSFISQSVQGMPSSPVVLNFVPFIPGDADGNKKINIFDAVAIVDYILSPETTTINVKAADIDKNNKVNIFDAVAVVDIILNNN